MTHAAGLRSRNRNTQGTPWLARLWAAFVTAMLLASFFSALIEPVSAAPETADAAQTAQEQGDVQPLDSDNDGLSDQDEANLGTDPNNPDTDGDGVPDGQDQDPLNAPQPVDTDGDGLTDDDEANLGTDPNNPDSDADGLLDGQDPDPLTPQAPDGQPTTAPDAQPTQGLLPQQLAPGSITVQLYACPPGVNLETVGPQDCTLYNPGAPATFGLQPFNLQQQTNAAGVVSFTQISPPVNEEVFLSLLFPPNTNSLPACTTDANDDGQSNTKPYAFATTSGTDTIRFPMEAAENINCDWFAQLQTGFEIRNTKYVCPPDYDMSVTPSTIQELRDLCDYSVEGVTFTVTANDGYNETLPAEPDGNPTVFASVPSGQFAMSETLPDGQIFLTLLCSRTGEDGDYAPVELGSNGEYPNAYDDGVLYCDWFNYVAPAFLVVAKFNCPEGVDYATLTPPQLATQCNEPVDPPVTFTVTVGGNQYTETTDPNLFNTAFFPYLETGEARIEETPPEGYELVRSVCADVDLIELIRSGQMRTTETQRQQRESLARMTGNRVFNDAEITNNGITWELLPFNLTGCAFFNAPIEDHTMTLYKWECPVGTLYNQTDPNYYSGECATEDPGVPFTLTDGTGTREFTSDTNGVQVDNIVLDANGAFTITELVPEGFGDPMRYCQPLNPPENGLGPYPWESLGRGPSITVNPYPGEDTQCFYYNIPYEDSTFTIRKWECPEGSAWTTDTGWYEANCTTPMNDVQFTLTDSMGPRAQSTANGQVQWTDVQSGAVSIAETIPPGYDPRIFAVCYLITYSSEGVPGSTAQPMAPVNGVLNFTITEPGTEWECDWYNRYLGDGEITVYKYTCPEGYNRNAWGANPAEDCTQATNGVTFTLDVPPPDTDLQSNTGDSVNGAVYFGSLTPGDYTLTEMVPSGIVDVFVWNCVGINTSSVHPIPLSVGPTLAFRIQGGDAITCYWYNVPEQRDGSMLVRKFDCTTPTYVSDVDCYTNTTGQMFDLQMWNGANWTTVQSGTTNVSGQLTFTGLDAGDYRLLEPGKTACLIKSGNITPANNIGVVAGTQTTVHVYNCSTPVKPPPTTPGKYPNTGAPPAQGPDSAFGVSLLGLLGLTGTATVSRRAFLKRAAIGTAAIGGGTVALNGMLAAQTLVPLDATVTPEGSPAATPRADCMYPATPEGLASTPAADGQPISAIQEIGEESPLEESTPQVTDGTPQACARGAVPVNIRIEKIGVDYPIEYLEIIDGAMTQPTGAEDIAWYKETARLGEIGNGLYAGHLNWWNMPEGPFFLLETLVEGDVVEVDGDDGETYRYIVQWTQDFPIDENPPDEALGFTDEEVITLITCGGEWNADVALYDHRTVARAIRDIDFVPGTPAPEV
jgi:hypothetical protein